MEATEINYTYISLACMLFLSQNTLIPLQSYACCDSAFSYAGKYIQNCSFLGNTTPQAWFASDSYDCWRTTSLLNSYFYNIRMTTSYGDSSSPLAISYLLQCFRSNRDLSFTAVLPHQHHYITIMEKLRWSILLGLRGCISV